MDEKMIQKLAEMRLYYAECAENAMPGSKAERKFTGYYAALDQAIARLSQGFEPWGWISVEDRLPDYGEELPLEPKWVLVWLGVESPLRMYVPVLAKYNCFSKTWVVAGLTADMNSRVKITHWMPLPEPPKEEDNDEAD